VVVRDFNLMGVTVASDKAQPPLIVDADAVLSDAISGQRFKTIARR
jgi:hypothetical protein